MSVPDPPADRPPEPIPPSRKAGAASAGGGSAGSGGARDGAEAADAEDESGGTVRRKSFLLRLPPDLMAELRAWSGQELRSLNGHLEFLLRDAVRRRRRSAGRKEDAP